MPWILKNHILHAAKIWWFTFRFLNKGKIIQNSFDVLLYTNRKLLSESRKGEFLFDVISNSVVTVRKRSLGKGNVFSHVSHSVQRGRGSLYDVTSCLAAWSHVPWGGGVSVSSPMFLGVGSLPQVLCSFQGVSVSGTMFLPGGSPWQSPKTDNPLDRDPLDRDPPWTKTPPWTETPWTETHPERLPCTVKSGR